MPEKKMRVPFSIPECSGEEIEEVAEVIKNGWLTTASRCFKFENNFAKYIGTSFLEYLFCAAFMICSCV